ncbi:Ig-like domain-containing protein [Tunturiibacter gelidiferens]|uniref:Ig-like domain-containing protein n=1 Tax=Tunturiibacter gelidiferens TaxID=3069689 RepID=UPI003D9BA774
MIREFRLTTFGCLLISITAVASAASSQAHLSQTVLQAPTRTSLDSPNGMALATTDVVIAVNVTGPTGAPVPAGAASLFDGTAKVNETPLVNGYVSFTINFAAVGIHQLTACFEGSANYLTSCGTLAFQALPPYTLQQTHQSGTAVGSATFTDLLKGDPSPWVCRRRSVGL